MQIRLGPALFVPNGQIGSFGSVSQLKTLVSSRTDLFDLAFSGPAAGGLLSALVFAVGLGLSTSGLPKASSYLVALRSMVVVAVARPVQSRPPKASSLSHALQYTALMVCCNAGLAFCRMAQGRPSACPRAFFCCCVLQIMLHASCMASRHH